MGGDPNDILRQADEVAARRATDREQYPQTREQLHALIRALPDDQVPAAAWLLETLHLSGLSVPSGALPPEGMEVVLPTTRQPPHSRWFEFLSRLISRAPRSWFDSEDRASRLSRAAGRAVAEAFDIPFKEGG